MQITLNQLRAVMLDDLGAASRYLDAINTAIARWNISTPIRVCAFLAQVAQESDELARGREDLYYTHGARIAAVWPREFWMPTTNEPVCPPNKRDAREYTRNPAKLGSFIYANRGGNGDEASGDGFRYRGGGLIEVTFKDGYRKAGAGIGSDLLGHPELIEVPEVAAATAGFYWRSNGCNELADRIDHSDDAFELITRKVAGCLEGLTEREIYLHRARQAIE